MLIFQIIGIISKSLYNKSGISYDGNINFPEIDSKYFIDGEDCYLSVACGKCSDSEYYSSFGDDYKDDFVIAIYLNGVLFDVVIYPKASWNTGVAFWDTDNFPFWIGVNQWNGKLDEVPCFKGNVYSTRLYKRYLDSSEIKDNYDMTLKYRNAF